MKKNSTPQPKNQKKKDRIPGYARQGYVRLWRTFRDDPLWKQKRRFSQWEAFQDLYFEARGKESPGFEFKKKKVDLKRGQLITSQRILAARWNWSRGSVEYFLRKLQIRKTITVKQSKLSHRNIIITILKYEDLNPTNSE